MERAKRISIQGIRGDLLSQATFMIHENDLIDLVYIESPAFDFLPRFSGKVEILDEVITLGYPKVAGYHNFLSAEKATVSSRYVATVGQVAASAEDIWMKESIPHHG